MDSTMIYLLVVGSSYKYVNMRRISETDAGRTGRHCIYKALFLKTERGCGEQCLRSILGR